MLGKRWLNLSSKFSVNLLSYNSQDNFLDIGETKFLKIEVKLLRIKENPWNFPASKLTWNIVITIHRAGGMSSGQTWPQGLCN